MCLFEGEAISKCGLINAHVTTFHNIKRYSDFCLLLACDGIWDVFENDTAISFVAKHPQCIATSADTLSVPEDSSFKSSVAEICDDLL